MPVIKVHKAKEGSAWAIWHVTESETELAFTAMESPPEEIASPQKKLEFLAVRALIKFLCDESALDYIGIHKDEYGKPYLKDLPHQISLSHSFPFVAVQIHPSVSVGVDIEQPKDKLLRIASRVLAPEEEKNASTNVLHHCVYWCAKEALYKIYGKRGLHFNSQLKIEPFELKTNGQLLGTIRAADQTEEVVLGYLIEPEFVFVWRHTDEE